MFIVCRVDYHDHKLEFRGHKCVLRAMACLLGLVHGVVRRCYERGLVDCLFDVTQFFQLDVGFVFADLQTVVDTLLDEGVDVFE